MARFAIRNVTKVLQSASGRLFGRLTAGDGPGEELTPAQARSLCSVYSTSEVDAIAAAKVSAASLALGTTGSDLNWSGTTLNVPDAGAAARGVVTTGAQTFAGNKTFSGATYHGGTGRVTVEPYLTTYSRVGFNSYLSGGSWTTGTTGFSAQLLFESGSGGLQIQTTSGANTGGVAHSFVPRLTFEHGSGAITVSTNAYLAFAGTNTPYLQQSGGSLFIGVGGQRLVLSTTSATVLGDLVLSKTDPVLSSTSGKLKLSPATSVQVTTAATFDASVSVTGALNFPPITKAALLATTPTAATAGHWRVTDSTPPNREVWPDGTDWRYSSDDTIVV